MLGITHAQRWAGESDPVQVAFIGVEKSGLVLPGRTQSRCELSNKPKVSKAGPLSKDIKSVVNYNLIALLSMVGFAALGLSVAAAAAGA